MKFQYVFEKSEAWKRAANLAKEVHDLDSRFHNHEKFDVIKRLREGSLKISADLAESNTIFTAKKQAKHKEKVNRGITRFLSHLLIAKELRFVSLEEFNTLKSMADSVLNHTHQDLKLNEMARV